MDFYDHRTQWDHFKKQPKWRERYPTANELYDGLKEIGIEEVHRNKYATIVYNQAIAEQTWYNQHRPYYKLFPDMIHLLSRTNIDVPCEYLHTPFPSIVIRLPVNHGIDFLTVEGRELRTMMVDETQDEIEVDPKLDSARRTGHRNIVVWMDFGETEDDFPERKPEVNLGGMPVMAYNRLSIREDESIETCLGRNVNEGTEGRISDEGVPITITTTDICFRIAVATCFLATGADKIIEPDVLTKDLQKYLDAQRQKDGEKQERLQSKAKKRGKFGWTVGRELLFPRASGSYGDSEGTGRELSYSHLRSAHFHLYHYGPGKTLTKVKLIRSLTVRPELPTQPAKARRGYKGVIR